MCEDVEGTRFNQLLIFMNKFQVADSLEKGTEHEDEYMISEKELLVNRWCSSILIPWGNS